MRMSALARAKPADITLKDAFDIYQKQVDSIHKLWGYYQVISVALLGYTVEAEKTNWSPSTFILIGVGYLIFAGSSLYVVFQSQKEIENSVKLVNLAAKKSVPIGKNLQITALKKEIVLIFQLVTAIVMMVAILVAYCDKNRAAPKSTLGGINVNISRDSKQP